jgi:hypothetical protein
MKKFNLFIWSLALTFICISQVGYCQEKEEWDDEGEMDEMELQMPNSVEELIDNVINEMELEAEERREVLNFIEQNFQPLKDIIKKELEAIGNIDADKEGEDDEDDEGDEEGEEELENHIEMLYEHAFDEIEHAAHMVIDVQKEDPAAFKQWLDYKKLDFKSYALGIEIRNLKMKKDVTAAEKAKIAKLETNLKELLDKLFDLRLHMDKMEIDDLNNEVEKMNKHIKLRESNKKRIIERHFEELIGDSEFLHW